MRLVHNNVLIVRRALPPTQRKRKGQLTFTIVVNGSWANLYPCTEGTGAPGPISFWCGYGSICQDNGSEGHFYDSLVPDNVATVVRNGSATSSSSTIPACTSLASTTSLPTPGSTRLSAAAGIGIGIAIGVVSIVVIQWFILSFSGWRVTRSINRASSAPRSGDDPPQKASQQYPTPEGPRELHGLQSASEMQGNTTHVVELPIHPFSTSEYNQGR